MAHAPHPSKWSPVNVLLGIVLVLGILQGVVLGGLVIYVTGEKDRTSQAVQRNNEGNCRLYQSFLPRDPSEVPTSAYGKRLVESVYAGIEFYHCDIFPYTAPASPQPGEKNDRKQ